MIHRILLAIIVSVAILLDVNLADGAADDRLSLRDAIRLTLDNNPQFRTYQLRSDALSGELQTAGLKPVIRVSSEVENVIGTGDLSWFQGTELTLALSQVVELGGKRAARTNLVNQRQNLLRAEQQVLELDLLSAATTRYIELTAAEQRLNLLVRSTELAREIHAAVSVRVDAGRAPEAERARAAAALSLSQLAEQSANYSIAAARLRLSSLWGELQPVFAETGANLLEVDAATPIQSLLDQLESNPAIEVFASETRLREAELREVMSRRSGDIEVGAGIRHLAELNDTALIFRASMPLKSKRRAGGAITTAQAKLLAVETERDTALLRMRAQLLVLDQQRRLALNEVSVIQ
ncbi:MAG: TolC family protein, partial [Gammaproteobacteria bacterium]|nr:TolC family protein [Gammaproteobacteria bacterium]